VTNDPALGDRLVDHTAELSALLGGSADSFTGKLLELIAKADPENRGRLKVAFPRIVLAWEQWQSCSPTPTFAQMRGLMPAIEERASRIEQMMQRFILGAGDGK
jgi:hypothetical protein